MFAYPHEVERIMRPQILNLKRVIRHHYAKRHEYGNGPTRNWIQELRRVDANSGYSKALAQIASDISWVLELKLDPTTLEVISYKTTEAD